MKQLLFILMLTANIDVCAQDKNVLVTPAWYRDTLTATRDTVDLAFARADEKLLNSWSVVAAATTGTDTLKVYTLSADGTTWSQCALFDVASGTYVTSIIVTTTAKEFLLADPVPNKIRLMTDDVSASCIAITAGKYRIY